MLAANVFALMGLRQLYFMLEGLLQRLVYLSQGLGVILFFIGVKLMLHALRENNLPFINGGKHVDVPEIPTLVSLAVIVVTLAVAAVASLYNTRGGDTDQPELGLDLAGDAPFDAGPGRGRQHDQPVEFLAGPRIGVLPFLRGRRGVLGKLQQVLGSRQPLLVICRRSRCGAGESLRPRRSRMR